MDEYKQKDNQDWDSKILSNYFLGSNWNSSDMSKAFTKERTFKFLDNWLSYIMNSKDMGYGSYQMVEVKLKIAYKYNDYGEYVKSDNLLLEIINDINQKKSTWIFEDQPDWRVERFKDLDGLILAKYCDVYNNYFTTVPLT